MELTRAIENRGPEEFTLRTASGGENNPKVKSKKSLSAFPLARATLEAVYELSFCCLAIFRFQEVALRQRARQ